MVSSSIPEHLTVPAPAPPQAQPGGRAVSHLELNAALNASAWTPVCGVTLLLDSFLQRAQDGMAAICLINHSRVIRMSAVPIPGGVGFVAAQRAWPQAGQSRQTLPFPPSRARQRRSADSWPRAAHFPPSSSSSGVPGPLEAAGTRAAGFRLDSASTQVLLAGLPCEASRDSLWRGRRRTPRTKTDSRKQGRPTHSSLVCPENEAKRCPPSGQGCLGNPGPGAG